MNQLKLVKQTLVLALTNHCFLFSCCLLDKKLTSNMKHSEVS